MASVTIEWPSKDNPTTHDVGDGLILGRSDECEAVIDDESISAKHAWIRKVGKRYLLMDLRSTNGITLNGEPVLEYRLHDGDTFCLCDIACCFEDPAERLAAEQRAKTGQPSEKDEETMADQCRDCGFLVPGHLHTCPRCGANVKGGVATHIGMPAISNEEHTRRFVRGMSALSFAGGLVGPLLLGVGWALGIVLGIMVLSGYRAEANADDCKMARRGILLGVLWLAAIVWVAQFIFL